MKLLHDNDFLEFAAKQEQQFISRASEFADEVKDRFSGNIKYLGDSLPWGKTHNKIALRPGEVSVWAGYNGHGKSQLLGQVCAWLLDKTWLIASMEMKPAATMQRMIRQVSGTRTPADEFINKFLTWTDERLYIYDQQDSVKHNRILGMAYYAAKVLGVNHLMIDSLMKCGIATDDYKTQKEFVDRLCWAAKTYNIHIHLVHHMRKGANDLFMPGKHDLKGSGDIADLVDNVFIVFRNKNKERAIEKGEAVEPNMPDCFLGVEKQRHGEWEGTFGLYFHPESLQYIPSPDRAMPYRVKQRLEAVKK